MEDLSVEKKMHYEERGREAARTLTRAVEEGREAVPPEEERTPLVCKPQKIESWRIFKIMQEFVEGFSLLQRYGLAATFFGSARCSFEDVLYKQAEELAARLAKRGFAVINGGSTGVMQASSKGAYEAGGARSEER